MHNMRTFYTLTITQIFSMIGSRMTSIALGIWLFNETGDSAPVLLASFFVALPQALAGIFAGVFADRWKRRSALLLSDAGQAVGSVLLLLSFLSGQFQIWHLYMIAFAQGVLGMIQHPAMEASVTMLVPDKQRDRANAIRQLSSPIAGVIAPVITGFLFTLLNVTGIILIDLVSFLGAVVVLWLVRIPEPPRVQVEHGASSVITDAKIGLGFLLQRRILLYMMVYAAVLNFLLSGPISLTTPYIIRLTGSEQVLGLLLGLMNTGMVVGGVIMFVWGGTRPRIHGIMLGLLFRALWLMVYGIARTPETLGLALFFLLSTNAIVDGSLMSLLQQKVPPHLQGRVFAILFQMMFIANPLSQSTVGLLVDNVFEPAVGSPGWSAVSPLVGDVPGAGMGLLIFGSGLLIFLITLAVYLLPRVRRVEVELPDSAVAAVSA